MGYKITDPYGDEITVNGRWSNGDPVVVATDGTDRWIEPNENGATWVPMQLEADDA